MRNTGFALIGGHGISEELSDGIYEHAQAFFARPLDEKMRLSFAERGRGQGYLPLRSEIVGSGRDPDAKPDLCESLTFANPRFDAKAPDNALDARLYRANLWPDDMPGFRETVEAYIAAGRRLALDLMRLSAAALDLPEDYFAPFFDKMELNLRCVLYPDQPDAPAAHALRYGPHTDFSGFTILRQDAAPGGLQVRSGTEWIDVPAVPGTLVINAGDLIQRWTNDRWVSTVHRVINPANPEEAKRRRQSFAFFHQPNWFAEIACLDVCLAASEQPKYEPVLSGPYLMGKFNSTVK